MMVYLKKRFASTNRLQTIVILSVALLVLFGMILSAQASTTIQFSNHKPANGSAVSVFNPEIFVYIKDGTYDLNASSLKVYVDGAQVSATFRFLGHWGVDSCGGPVWIIDSRKEGTVTYTPVGLSYGTHTVEVRMTNSAGVTAVETWSFTIAGTIEFGKEQPTSGAAVGQRRPQISVQAYAPNGAIAADDVTLTIGGESVIPTLTYELGYYLISGQPVQDLPDGNHSVVVSVYNHGKGTYDSYSWSFAVRADVVAMDWAPAKGSTINISNPQVSVYVSAGANKLDQNSVSATLNGVPVTATLQFKGVWLYDSCGFPYYVVTSYNEGTVSFNTIGLENGTHTVSISVANVDGEAITETWSFTVQTEMRFFSQTPGSNTTTSTSFPRISVRAADGTKDANHVRMFVDGEAVTPVVGALENNVLEISYVPQQSLYDGIHAVRVEVLDIQENMYKTTAWSFTVDAAPKVVKRTPVAGSLLNKSSTAVTVEVRHATRAIDGNSVSAKVNGVPVAVQYTHWIEEYNGVIEYEDTRYGFITFNAVGLHDGANTLEIRVADVQGNLLVDTWTLNVAEVPVFSGMTPANKGEVRILSQVSVLIHDNTSVNWGSVVMKVNGSVVPHVTDPANNMVKYLHNFATGTYQVNVAAKDLAGNLNSVTWSFIVDKNPPTLRNFYYRTDDSGVAGTVHNFNGLIIKNGILKFTGELTDSLVALNSNATATLIGTETKTGKAVNQLLDITFRYEGMVDSCTGMYIVTNKKRAYLSYAGVIKDGNYTLVVYAEDSVGNSVTQTFAFKVETPPVIDNLTPLKYGVQERTPEISATVKDLNGTIVPESIVMKVNGDVVAHKYDATKNKVTYTPAVALADEIYYTVYLTASDDQGLTTTRSWKFYINAKNWPDMSDSSYTNCTSCHAISGGTNALENGTTHKRLQFSGGHNYSGCYSCHGYISYPADCAQCHGEEGYYDYAPHGSSPDIKYWATNYDPYFPLRVKENREMFDCVICHQPGTQLKAYVGAWSTPTRLMSSHDIPDLHRVDTENCSECHAMSLTREHARDGRKDGNGQPMTCVTCHESQRTDVTTAISTGDTDCGACHGIETTGAGHASMHEVNYGAQCAECHGTNMMSEKVYHQNDCNGCHSSTVPKVLDAIRLQNRTCFGCHESPHGVKMMVLRDDIPMYSGLTWSKPDPARVWAGEGWLPEQLNNDQALVLFSERMSISQQTVYQYYKDEMNSKGWTLVEDTSGDGTFNLLYRKGRRHCLIQLYNGVAPGSSGSGNIYRIVKVYN